MLAGHGAPQENARWLEALDNLAKALDSAFALRHDCRLGFPPDCWNADCGGLPLAQRFRNSLSKERYLRVLARAVHLSGGDLDLAREVRFQGAASVSMTCADMAAARAGRGWVASLAANNSHWQVHTLQGARTVLQDSGESTGPDPCEIGNLAAESHVQHWRSDLLDWGRTVAASAHLADVAGHPVVMYSAPLEHGPPHVHLLESRNAPRTLAKYRIDVFERAKGPPHWDAEMREWVADYQDQLLQSWQRCQAGGHPYALVRVH